MLFVLSSNLSETVATGLIAATFIVTLSLGSKILIPLYLAGYLNVLGVYIGALACGFLAYAIAKKIVNFVFNKLKGV